MALLIRRGIIKTRAQREEEKKAKSEKKFYDIWQQRENAARTKSELAREKMAYPAPKLPLPGCA